MEVGRTSMETTITKMDSLMKNLVTKVKRVSVRDPGIQLMTNIRESLHPARMYNRSSKNSLYTLKLIDKKLR